MKERPIIFSGPMVRALLDGSKAQTRRICKLDVRTGMPEPEWASLLKCCPYGQAGDRLWVRETFIQGWPGVDGNPDQWNEDGSEKPIHTWYRATDPDISWMDDEGGTRGNTPWKPSIFMPRAASRITLEITGVRVERVQNISAGDAAAEGLKAITKDGKMIKYGLPDSDGLPGTDDTGWPWQEWRISPIDAYQHLWDSINAKRAPWASNPFVWVVSFKGVPA